MIRLHAVRVNVQEDIDLKKIVSRKLKVSKEKIRKITIHKKSIDCRNKKMFSYVFDLDVVIDQEEKHLGKNVTLVKEEKYILPEQGSNLLNYRPVIIGAGPAGLFCAYELAKYGYKPLIIERGEPIEERIKTVEHFWKNGKLNHNSNIQFGEGGAGTFSDGKLNTLVKDKNNRMKEVFETFVDCGAPEEILYEHHPHIGTDLLRKVIINLRKKIISYGGEFKYNSLFEDIIVEENKLEAIIVNGEIIKTNILILAIGHSARDTFRMLYNKQIKMESKPFAVGIRVIHPQKLIDENQYPIYYPFLPPANYKLTYQTKSGRGVYSFCMCPGGFVVDSRSAKDGVVVNGMSNYKRDSGFANSAIVVTVGLKDYGDEVFAGISFQEKIEKKAYQVGVGLMPVSYFGYYKSNEKSIKIDTNAIKGNYKESNINEIFPEFINDSLKEGMEYFGQKIKGFDNDDTIIVAPESRTSSPVRIIRNENYEANIKGIYPCGEGAGYAGGITTSAMDGIKIFEEIYSKYKIKNVGM